MHVRVITPEAILYEGNASMVQVPGEMGDFGVLEGHAPLVSTLRPGVVKVDTGSSRDDIRIVVADGVAEVSQDGVVILSAGAKSLSGLSKSDADAEVREAEQELAEAISEQDNKAAEKRLAMAQAVAEAI